jgi:HPt (histidine-containing phosphotransfer) domain-containing protein
MKNTILKQQDVTVDISMLYDISGNDESFIIKMIETFLQTMPGTIEKIVTYYQQQDWENMYKAAHFAKSSFGIIKVNDLLTVCQTIEKCGKTLENLQLLPGLVDTLQRQSAMASEILKREITEGL